MQNDRGLIFIHIPKTAGSTLRPIMDRNHPRDVICKLDFLPRDLDAFLRLPEPARSRIRVLQGHFPFGLHKHLVVPSDYLTILRNPVDRIISMYYWIHGNQDHVLNKLVRAMSLKDFADSGFEITANHQTSLISGLTANSNSDALAVAKKHLQDEITAFGLNERFDESLLLFKKRLGWKHVFYSRRNVTRSRPRGTEVPDSVLDVIQKHNSLDLELYEFARQRFDETISALGPSFQDEVRRFQRINNIWARFDKGRHALRRSLPDPVKAGLKKVLGRR
ncbi:MAG: sulfotransferase family 2 domain-containing protein [Pyrinomonadaceae bacterium]|nr:sulfotransferase family 2 domain-containing protein [Pyrinomonadaceae bacterium]